MLPTQKLKKGCDYFAALASFHGKFLPGGNKLRLTSKRNTYRLGGTPHTR